MPFGHKSAEGRSIDFDAVWRQIIAPAIEPAGMQQLRADEEQFGGIIHKPMLERLVLCDYVICDLTFANANVFYERGIRHAKPGRSIFSSSPTLRSAAVWTEGPGSVGRRGRKRIEWVREPWSSQLACPPSAARECRQWNCLRTTYQWYSSLSHPAWPCEFGLSRAASFDSSFTGGALLFSASATWICLPVRMMRQSFLDHGSLCGLAGGETGTELGDDYVKARPALGIGHLIGARSQIVDKSLSLVRRRVENVELFGEFLGLACIAGIEG